MRSSFAALLFVALPVLAQLDRGAMTGTITDPSGAAVPNVKVRIVQTTTGERFEIVTNESGQFNRPNVPIGDYEISFEADGFRRATRRGIVLKVSEVLRLDLQLEVGSTAESVQVPAELPRVNAEPRTSRMPSVHHSFQRIGRAVVEERARESEDRE